MIGLEFDGCSIGCGSTETRNETAFASTKKEDIDATGEINGPFSSEHNFRQLFIPPLECIHQGNLLDCGVFVCLHALQFICMQLSHLYTKADFGMPDAENKLWIPDKYLFMRLLQGPE